MELNETKLDMDFLLLLDEGEEHRNTLLKLMVLFTYFLAFFKIKNACFLKSDSQLEFSALMKIYSCCIT